MYIVHEYWEWWVGDRGEKCTARSSRVVGKHEGTGTVLTREKSIPEN